MGVALLWIEVVIGLPGVLSDAMAVPQGDANGRGAWFAGMAIAAFFLGLTVILNWKTWQGRNWARIAGLALLILGLAMTLFGYAVNYFVLKQPISMFASSWQAVVYLLQSILDIVAFGLLFSPGANAWFRAMRPA